MDKIYGYIWLSVNWVLLSLEHFAVIIGIISSIAFACYNVSKWYQQTLETRKFKKENPDL